MSLFDDDAYVVEGARKKSRRAAPLVRSGPAPATVEIPGTEAPYTPPGHRRLHFSAIEAAAQAVATGERAGAFRCDAVTHTLVVMLFQQFELGAAAPPGITLHPGLDDAELTNSYGWALEQLRAMHGPRLFPAQDPWPPAALRRWTALWWGVDLVGRYGELEADYVAETFQWSASMSGKQKAWGTFITPFNLCRTMAMMVTGLHERPWTESFCEPCCGPGSMVVAHWDLVRCRINALLGDGVITAGESHELVARWCSRVAAADIDAESAWACAAQMSVRTGFTFGRVPHPYRWRDDPLHEPLERLEAVMEILRG